MSKAKQAPNTTTPAQKTKVFVVVRDTFDASEYHRLHFNRPTNSEGERNNGVPVRAFATKQAANDYAEVLDDEIRRTFPPSLFFCEDTDGEDTFGPKLAMLVQSLSLPPFKPGKYDYESGKLFREWWAENAPNMSAEQKAALWEPFAEMTFHHVKEIELEG